MGPMSPRLETITGRIGGALGRIDGALQDRLPEVDERVKVYTDPRPPYGVIGLTLRR